MSTTVTAPDQLLEHMTALAKSHKNLEILDRATILHVYMQLSKLDPSNEAYRKHVEDAAASLQQAVSNLRD